MDEIGHGLRAWHRRHVLLPGSLTPPGSHGFR